MILVFFLIWLKCLVVGTVVIGAAVAIVIMVTEGILIKFKFGKKGMR